MKIEAGQVAVITGGASGIGLALAQALASRGMRLVLADIEQQALDRAAEVLQAQGAQVLAQRTDVAEWAQVDRLAEAALERFGRIDLAVNNAGVSILGPTWEMSLDDWRWVYDVNVWGVIHGIRTFVPRLRDQGRPVHLVNTASMAAFGPIGTHAPYCSSKAAVVSMTQALHSELRSEGAQVGVSCLCPGMVDTQIHRSWRNRPEGDRPWSARESQDPTWLREAAHVQGAGVPAHGVAERVVQAVEADRFWVFSGDNAVEHVQQQMAPFFDGEDPPVVTAQSAFDPRRWAPGA